jgi:hypothetical protein
VSGSSRGGPVDVVVELVVVGTFVVAVVLEVFVVVVELVLPATTEMVPDA